MCFDTSLYNFPTGYAGTFAYWGHEMSETVS